MSNVKTEGFPAYTKQVRGLVSQHLQLRDEPLLLAIYYQPDRQKKDIFLFEVIEGFGNGHSDSDQEFFEVTVQSTAGFPMHPNQSLHLVLTSPQELETAVKEKWNHARELEEAVGARQYKIIHISRKKKARELKELIHAQ